MNATIFASNRRERRQAERAFQKGVKRASALESIGGRVLRASLGAVVTGRPLRRIVPICSG